MIIPAGSFLWFIDYAKLLSELRRCQAADFFKDP